MRYEVNRFAQPGDISFREIDMIGFLNELMSTESGREYISSGMVAFHIECDPYFEDNETIPPVESVAKIIEFFGFKQITELA